MRNNCTQNYIRMVVYKWSISGIILFIPHFLTGPVEWSQTCKQHTHGHGQFRGEAAQSHSDVITLCSREHNKPGSNIYIHIFSCKDAAQQTRNANVGLSICTSVVNLKLQGSLRFFKILQGFLRILKVP